MKTAALSLLALAFCWPLRAAENPASAPQYYARDARTEIAVTAEEGRDLAFEFRIFGDEREGRVVYHGGDLKKATNGTWRYDQDADGKKSFVEITGEPGNVSLMIDAGGIENLGEQTTPLNGVYQKVSAADALARAKQRFDAADAALNADYQKLRGELDAKQKLVLRDSQREWIEERDGRAEWSARGAENPKGTIDYWDEMLSQTTTRIGFLKVYTGKNVPPGLTGEYGDFNGASLSLELTKAGLRFSLEVVRGPTSHLGDISGLALKRSEKLFVFKETVPAEERGPDRQAAELRFTVLDAHRVKIEGKNTGAHHGARAYFDGTYLKTGNLAKPIEID